MNQGIDYTALIILPPFFAVFLIFSGLARSSRRASIARLKERIKSLPLDEEALRRRLEMFDQINLKVKNFRLKMKLLRRLAYGQGGKWKEKKRKIFEPGPPEHKENDFNKMLYLGWVPSGITFQCKFLPASKQSHF